MKIKKLFMTGFKITIFTGTAGIFCLWLLFNVQGDRNLSNLPWDDTEVTFDSFRIPTIYGNNWNSVFRTQGYVVASERLWQMDLLRRKSEGSLSEIFGEKTLELDKKKKIQDLARIAHQAVENLPQNELQMCQSFTEGVNSFIQQNPMRWGAEYLILQTSPKKWTCKDSVLIQMEMITSLTDTEDQQLIADSWSQHIPDSWMKVLFSNHHPWNRASLEKDFTPKKIPLPPNSDWLNSEGSLRAENITTSSVELDHHQIILGSNSWIYSGENGTFLANDPHLSFSVPGILFLSRLHVAADDWVAGATVPGIPGCVIGVNPYLAWSLTNTGELAQELFKETISQDQQYVMDHQKWLPLAKKSYQIHVRGEQSPRTFEALHTPRGYLQQHPYLADTFYSTSWQLFDPSLIRLPVNQFINSKSIDDFMGAIDHFTLPSMNVLIADRKGHAAHRVSGTGIQRNYPKHSPKLSTAGVDQWVGWQPQADRPRKRTDLSQKKPVFLASANQRVWADSTFHFWSSDDRQQVIEQTLAKSPNLELKDMFKLQASTLSQHRKNMAKFVLTHASEETRQQYKALFNKINNWDGTGEQDQMLFSAIHQAEKDLESILLDRLLKRFQPNRQEKIRYKFRNYRSWVITLFENPKLQNAFGTDSNQIANFLALRIATHQQTPSKRKWTAQHPFVANVPILGKLFKVDTPELFGDFDTVNATKPSAGPTMRFVVNLSDLSKSRWILPTGNSGHPLKRGYKSMQHIFHTGGSIPIFWKPMTKDPRWSHLSNQKTSPHAG